MISQRGEKQKCAIYKKAKRPTFSENRKRRALLVLDQDIDSDILPLTYHKAACARCGFAKRAGAGFIDGQFMGFETRFPLRLDHSLWVTLSKSAIDLAYPAAPQSYERISAFCRWQAL